MSAAGEIVIRDMQRLSDYNDCARLQQEVWAFPDADAEIVTASYLVAMHHYGGICLGAFDDSEMVGFVIGFLGSRGGKLFHHSHMLAVRPAYRARGVGEMGTKGPRAGARDQPGELDVRPVAGRERQLQYQPIGRGGADNTW